MGITHTFIDRPILSSVVSIIIVIIGAIAYGTLPITQYPEIAPPTIQVSAAYPGANAETVASTVATPIEQEINGVEDMLYMRSENTGDGRMALSITFKLGTDLDEAQVLVQNRVAIAEARLPEPVRRLGVTVQKSSPDLMMVVHITSPDGSRDNLYISNYARSQIVDRLARVDGVGQARIFGERAYSMRVWLDPDRISAFGLTAGEVVNALRSNNVQVAAGVLNQLPLANPGAYELSVETQGRLLEPGEFERIVVKRGPDGRTVRVSDVARVELAAQDILNIAYLDADNALPIGIFQRPGSNALDTADEVISLMQELSAEFPPGLEHRIVYNPTEFIAQSIDAVYQTIIEAVVLVVIVIVVFLQNFRAAIIPILAIPISLIGTFAVLSVLGFSLNNLSLFALVLAIGIVVDDAIIVVENVERYLAEGLSPRDAAHKTMDEVAGALIATTLVLLAVFIPAAFVPGITGQFYQQFAVTISVSTAISSVVSLTLSPALCTLLLRTHSERTAGPRTAAGKALHAVSWPFRKFADGFNWVFDKLSAGYATFTRSLIRVAALMLLVYAGLVVLAGERFASTPQGFIPQQDQGYLIAVAQLPPGSSLARTDAVIQNASAILREIPGVVNTVGFAGLDGATFTNAPNAGVIFFTMKPFAERAGPQEGAFAILGRAFGALQQVKEANIFVIAPPSVRGIGTGGGWKMYVQDQRGRGVLALEEATNGLLAAANQDPQLSRVFTFFNTKTPKIYADIDRTKAQMLNVPTDRLLETLEVYLGSAYVNDFNFLGRTYRVTAQADGPFRDNPQDILELRTRSETGAMIPLGTVADLQETTGPHRLPRYNLFAAAEVQGSPAPGVASGEALAAVEKLAAQVLPEGFSFEWTELALQQKLAGNEGIIVFALAVVFVFLVLAALYESWLLPLAVILIVPMCLLAAILGVNFRGLDNNILVQVGLIVLVGLAAKNAILIVEFARQAEDDGADRVRAAVEAARVRLRPILMTSFAFVLGVVPLMIATGAGAEMRQSLGTAVFSGMLGVTIAGLVFTPLFYVVCRWLGSLGDRVSGRGADTSKPDTEAGQGAAAATPAAAQ
ncbi:MAG: multidrug efflux RND transporter permease subunit [Pseudomonadota bacterium]